MPDHGLDPRISLQKLEVFCLVVELGGVHRAAERLYCAQPVVSAHLRSLQDRLGAELFRKQGRRLVLTEAGQATYTWARDVLSRGTELTRELDGLADGSAGSAVLMASMSIGTHVLPEILIAFRRRRPLARITLHVSDTESALAATASGGCDFCVVMTDAAADPDVFTTEDAAPQELVLVTAPGDPNFGNEITVAEMAALPYVRPPAGLTIRRIQDAALAAIGAATPDVAIELGNSEGIKQAVRAGLGATILSRTSVAAELTAGTLREVVIAGASLTAPVQLIRRTSKRLTPLQRDLFDAVRAALADQ